MLVVSLGCLSPVLTAVESCEVCLMVQSGREWDRGLRATRGPCSWEPGALARLPLHSKELAGGDLLHVGFDVNEEDQIHWKFTARCGMTPAIVCVAF